MKAIESATDKQSDREDRPRGRAGGCRPQVDLRRPKEHYRKPEVRAWFRSNLTFVPKGSET